MIFSKKEKQFREAYSDYYAIVFNSIYSRIQNTADAEDICHDVFIAFYNKLETIDDQRRWLLAAVKYGVLDYLKKKKRNDAVDIETLENDLNLAFVNGMRDVRIIINETIDDINTYRNEKEKTLFELVAKNNYSLEEAGNLLGLSRRQAKYLYGLASHNILKALQKKGIRDIEDIL